MLRGGPGRVLIPSCLLPPALRNAFPPRRLSGFCKFAKTHLDRGPSICYLSLDGGGGGAAGDAGGEAAVTTFKKITKKLVGELLIDNGVITREKLDKALERKKETGKLLGETLVELGFANEEDIAGVVSTQYRIPYLPLGHHDVDKDLVALLPRELAAKYRCFPLDRIGTVLTVAMENPLDEKAVEEIQKATGARVLCYVSTPSEIRAAIEQHYPKSEGAPAPPERHEPSPPAPEAREVGQEGGVKIYDLEGDGLTEV